MTIKLTHPDGKVSTYEDWRKVAEDICAFESGEGRVSTEILNNFHRMIRSARWCFECGYDNMVTIFAGLLGYEVTTQKEQP